MDKSEIILLTVVLIFASVRIYQKYFRKNQNSRRESNKGNADQLSTSREDDYEPYSSK
jgi:hypothetical protein